MLKKLLILLALASPAAAQEQTFKIATLAPEGSAWMNLFHEWQKKVDEHSQGRIKMKFYSGGVAGDEREAVRKMKLGQLNGAAVTSIGLGLIQSEVRVLELAMLINGYDELDYVRNQLDSEFRKKFEDKGYVLLAWGDVGPVHLFSNIPLRGREDLMKTKLWAWIDDPLVRALFAQLGVTGVPLGVPDVLTSLQTGLINACYGSPLATLVFQWNGSVKYMTSMHITQAIGATVVTRAAFDKLPADLKKILLDDSRALEAKLLTQIRADNQKSLATMKAQGLQVIESPKEMVKEFQTQAEAIRPKLEPSVYSHEFRMKVEKLIAEYRQSHK